MDLVFIYIYYSMDILPSSGGRGPQKSAAWVVVITRLLEEGNLCGIVEVVMDAVPFSCPGSVPGARV